MDLRLSLYAVLSGLLAAIALLPLMLGWMPAQVTADWPWALHPLAAWLPAALAPLALVWGSARGAGAVVDRGAGRARGALAGVVSGATMSLFLVGPAPGLWSLMAIVPALGTPNDGLALGQLVATGATRSISGAGALWVLCLAVGFGAGLVGGSLAPLRHSGAEAPTLDGSRVSGMALSMAVCSALLLPALTAALEPMTRSLANLNDRLQAEGLAEAGSPSAVLLLAWLVWGALALAGALSLRGSLLRLRSDPSRRARQEGWVLLAPVLTLLAPALSLLLTPDLAAEPGAWILGIGTLGALLAATRVQPGPPVVESSGPGGWLIGGLFLLGSLPAMTIAAGLSAGMGVVALIPAITTGSPPPGGLLKLIDDLLLASIGLPVLGMVGTAAIGGALWWLSSRQAAPQKLAGA